METQGSIMKMTMKTTTLCLGAWLGAVGLAFALAIASPNESSVMGHMPASMSQTLSHQPLAVPEDFPSERTLALITFKGDQRAQAETWIEGLNLKNDATISWMRVSVLNDPGTTSGRNAAETRLRQNYTSDSERAKLVPVFTDKADFVRAAGLNGINQSYAVVVNREGDVLARVEGQFDAAKAELLRETLSVQGIH